MSIYTKTGDKGTTSLFDSVRVKKYSLRVDTYGTFDECLAQVSVAEKLIFTAELQPILVWIQEKLFLLNAEVATSENQAKLAAKSTLITSTDTQQLEAWIDNYLSQLPEIHQFILPGGHLSSAQLHVARTICRRGERRLIELAENEGLRPELLQFVNRLSDCLYVLARVEDFNQQQEKIVKEVLQRYQQRALGETAGAAENFRCLQAVFNACIAKAQELAVPVSMTVLDQNGHLIGSYRMPDSLLVSIEMAHKKAYSAVAMKAATADLQSAVQPGSELYQLETMTAGQIVTFGGGVPIFDQAGRLAGGLGISGGSVNEDQQIAQAGLARFAEVY